MDTTYMYIKVLATEIKNSTTWHKLFRDGMGTPSKWFLYLSIQYYRQMQVLFREGTRGKCRD